MSLDSEEERNLLLNQTTSPHEGSAVLRMLKNNWQGSQIVAALGDNAAEVFQLAKRSKQEEDDARKAGRMIHEGSINDRPGEDG